jgi:hypothetical protein
MASKKQQAALSDEGVTKNLLANIYESSLDSETITVEKSMAWPKLMCCLMIIVIRRKILF